MSEQMDKAARAIQVNLFREGLLDHSTPWAHLSPATRTAWLSAVESALPHLEAHFREKFINELAERSATEPTPIWFWEALEFLRESDR